MGCCRSLEQPVPKCDVRERWLRQVTACSGGVGPGSSLVPDDERMRNLAWRDTIGGVPVGYMSTTVGVAYNNFNAYLEWRAM